MVRPDGPETRHHRSPRRPRTPAPTPHSDVEDPTTYGPIPDNAARHRRAHRPHRRPGRRVGLFLRVEDFDAAWQRLRRHGVRFRTAPRTEPYGRVVVFEDPYGNAWDLLGPVDPPAS
ncbi:MAG: VOC family protein [Acidimicrobiales bacterium]|nr:VOC family protein [Acidimicrobiales bacterium]